MKITILQIKDIEKCPYSFFKYDWAKDNWNILDYKIVYEYEKDNNIWLDDNDMLEEIFQQFNIAKPDDFKGHSLSVSDIVMLDNRVYYVDSVGYQRLI